MSTMDKKQRKAKKREEKAKKLKMKKVEESQHHELTATEKKSGKIQLYIFLGIALIGAVTILLNV